MITIAEIVEQLTNLQNQMRTTPRFTWGTVVSTNPLKVVLDSDYTDTPVIVGRAIATPPIGTRVFMVFQRRQGTVIGRATP